MLWYGEQGAETVQFKKKTFVSSIVERIFKNHTNKTGASVGLKTFFRPIGRVKRDKLNEIHLTWLHFTSCRLLITRKKRFQSQLPDNRLQNSKLFRSNLLILIAFTVPLLHLSYLQFLTLLRQSPYFIHGGPAARPRYRNYWVLWSNI